MWYIVDQEYLDKSDLKDLVGETLNLLTDRERTVLVRRFWFGDTLEECGKYWGTNRERARQIEQRALRSLRSPDKSKFFQDFLPIDRSNPDEKPIIQKRISIFDMHPAFREINLYARKLPLLSRQRKLEEKERKKQEKLQAEREKAERERKRRDDAWAASSQAYAEALRRNADEQEKHLWRRSEQKTDFDVWYEKSFGKSIKD